MSRHRRVCWLYRNSVASLPPRPAAAMLPSLTRSAWRSSPISARSASPMGSTTFPRSSRCLSRMSRAARSSSSTPPATEVVTTIAIGGEAGNTHYDPGSGCVLVAVDPRTHRVYLPLENVDGKPVLRILETAGDPEDRSISITSSVVLAWLPVTPPAWGMLVRVSVVVVPTIRARSSSAGRIARSKLQRTHPTEYLYVTVGCPQRQDVVNTTPSASRSQQTARGTSRNSSRLQQTRMPGSLSRILD